MAGNQQEAGMAETVAQQGKPSDIKAWRFCVAPLMEGTDWRDSLWKTSGLPAREAGQ